MKLHAALEGQRKYIMIMEYVGHSSLYEVLERQKGKRLTEQCKKSLSLILKSSCEDHLLPNLPSLEIFTFKRNCTQRHKTSEYHRQ